MSWKIDKRVTLHFIFLQQNFPLWLYLHALWQYVFLSGFPVISRNILTDSASSQPPANEDAAVNVQSDSERSDVSQSAASDASDINQSTPKELSPETPVLQGNQSEHSSAPVARQNEELDLREKGGNKKRDLAKPAHADEM